MSVDLINNWAQLKPGTYIKDNTMMGTRQDKAPLINVFKATAKSLDSGEIYTTDVLLQAAHQVHSRFAVASQKKATSTMNGLYRVFGSYVLRRSYDHLVERIAQSIAKNYQGNLKGLVEKFSIASGDFEKELLKRCIDIAKINIEKRETSKGIIYKVTNSHGVTSWLVGTIHKASRHMCNNQAIFEAVDASKELITETGDNKLVNAMYWLQSLHPTRGLAHCVDKTLMDRARQRKIPISGLESIDDQLQYAARANAYKGKKCMVQAAAAEAYKKHREHMHHEMVEAWQEGDPETIAFFVKHGDHPESAKIMFEERNGKWLEGNQRKGIVSMPDMNPREGLVSKFKNTEQPICVAVGAGHCFFDHGLVCSLRKEGLVVERAWSE